MTRIKNLMRVVCNTQSQHLRGTSILPLVYVKSEAYTGTCFHEGQCHAPRRLLPHIRAAGGAPNHPWWWVWGGLLKDTGS